MDKGLTAEKYYHNSISVYTDSSLSEYIPAYTTL